MRQTFVGTLFVAALAAASSAWAIPSLTYTGNQSGYVGINVNNDTGQVLPAILLKSGNTPIGQFPTGVLLSGTALQVPGAFLDNFDQPYAVVYLNFPTGSHFIGYVFDGRQVGPACDLTLEYYQGSLTAPIRLGDVGICPEPASASLAGLAALGGLRHARRRRTPQTGT